MTKEEVVNYEEDKQIIRELLAEGEAIERKPIVTAMIITRTLHVKYCRDCMRYNRCQYQDPRADHPGLVNLIKHS